MSVQPIAPAARPSASPPPGEDGLFRFHPRASNPELWRTTVPLAVRQGCGRHKGLISTWMAVHWLIVLHAANGRRAFGMRAIAAEAGVGRNELAGPQGYIQRLVDLGLLAIVGYEAVPGMREPRPIYHIDLSELEARSLELVPAILREHRLPPPPRPAPDPRQLALFDADAPSPASVTVYPAPVTDRTGSGTASYPASVTDYPALVTDSPGNGTAGHFVTDYPDSVTVARPENGTERVENRTAAPETGTALASDRTHLADRGEPLHETGTVQLPSMTVPPEIVPALSRKGDVDRENEREKERGSEDAPAPSFIQQIAAQAVQAVLQTLARQGILTAPQDRAALAEIPPTPEGQPELPDDLAALWRGDRAEISSRDRHQLTILARELNGPTDGYGAYWVGRAILLADRCLSERGQAIGINYLRTMLRRWQREDSWGSDLETEPAGEPPAGRQRQRPASSEPATSAHPAVAAYSAAFGRTPNAVQADQISAAVGELGPWQRVLTEWLANGWQAGAVAKMLDRYAKDTAPVAPAVDMTPVSITPIYHHPGLSDPQRDRWILRFHAATSLAEKRALLAQLAQEHPL